MVILTFFQAKSYNQEIKPQIVAFGTNWFQIARHWGIFIFTYCNMLNFHQAYTTLKFPTIRRVKKLSYWVFGALGVFYWSFSMTGYYSLGFEARELDIFPQRQPLGSSADYAMRGLKASKFFLLKFLVLYLSLFVTYIVCLMPVKENILRLFQVEIQEVRITQNFSLTFFICFLSIALAIFYPKCADWFGLVGAYFGTMIVFSFPGKLLRFKYISFGLLLEF